MNDDLAGASPVDQPVGRPCPKRYEGGRIKGGCSLHDAEKPGRCQPYHHRCPEPRCVDCCGVVDEHDILECPHCGKQWTAPTARRPTPGSAAPSKVASNAELGAWVKCSDRLPDKEQFFLAYGPGLGNYVGGPEMDICRFDGDLWTEGGTELAFQEQGFTHWMPLPAPPVSA